MRTAFTVATGLIATASAANLRSSDTLNKVAALNSIKGLAEKYDCVTGGKGLEEVVAEISGSNVKATTELTAQCKADHVAIGAVQVKENDRADGIMTAAPIDAGKVRAAIVSKATDLHDALDAKHQGIVAGKELTATAKAATRATTTASHNAMTKRYNAEVVSLKNDRKAAADSYTGAMKSASDDLKNGKSAEDSARNTKITTAQDTKTSDDGVCRDDYTARQVIVASDTAIVGKLEALENEIESLGTRAAVDGAATSDGIVQEAADYSTAFVEIREKVHANYNELLEKKKSEIVQFNAACTRAYGVYDSQLKGQKDAAQNVRDTTDSVHGAHYTQVKDAADLVTKNIVDHHTGEVNDTTQAASAALAEYGRRLGVYKAATLAFQIESKAVATERASTKHTAAGDRASIASTKAGIIAQSDSFLAKATEAADAVLVVDFEDAKQSMESRKAFLAGDIAVIQELEPMLAKLGACSGGEESASAVTALLDTGCALNEKKLQTKFLELQKSSAPRTTGSFADWKQRIMDERDDADRVRGVEEDAATAGRNKEVKRATDLRNEEVQAATDTAQDETDAVNTQEAKDNTEYDRRYAAVNDPYLESKKQEAIAEGNRDNTAEAQSKAESAAEVQIPLARADNKAKTEAATQQRATRIAADNTAADKMDVDAAAAHKTKTSAKKSEQESEDELLRKEQAKLEKVVAHLGELEVAGAGLDMESTGSIKDDIAFLKNKLEEEKVNSAADRDTCLSASESQEATTIAAANDAYDVAEGILVATNEAETSAAEEEKTAQFNAHSLRDETNESDMAASTDAFNTAVSEDKIASEALKIAKEVQADEMGRAQTALNFLTAKALAAEAKYIADANTEGRGIKSAAAKVFADSTKEKNDSCTAEHKLLSDEKDVLGQVLKKVGQLVTVGTDKTGEAHDASFIDYSSSVKSASMATPL